MHSHDGSLLLYIQPVWEAAAFPCNGFKHRCTPQRNGCTDRCTRPLESLNRCRGWPQSKRPEALLFAMFLTGPPSAAMQKRRLHTDGSDSGGEHIAKVAFLIRARSVVQVHPGPPFIFSRLPGVVPKTSTHNPTHTSLISLHQLRSHSQRR